MPPLVKLQACSCDETNPSGLTAANVDRAGVEDLTKRVRKWIDEPSTYDPKEMRACLDSWREVLFSHLDQEASTIALHHSRIKFSRFADPRFAITVAHFA